MSDRLNGQSVEAPPTEISLDGAGLFHLPLCSRDIAVSRHGRIAVVWFHPTGGDQRVGVPIPIDALRDLALASVDAATKPPTEEPS